MRIAITRALVLVAAAAFALALAPAPKVAYISVRHVQGSLHGFLTLSTLDGSVVADGEAMQSVSGGRIVARTVFHFRDGSLDDETAIYTQNRVYRLVSDHHVQEGPTFPHPATLDVDVASGHVVVRTKDEHGAAQVDDQKMSVPGNLSNGILPTLLQDAVPADLPLTLPLLATTPSPRLVNLVITSAGTTPLSLGATSRAATDYLVKTDIGGLTGVLAGVFGKQPPDAHMWILPADVPVFVKSEAPMYAGGPLLRVELASPRWR